MNNCVGLKLKFEFNFNTNTINITGKSHHYKNQNVKNQKEPQKNCKPSQHQNYLKKLSEH